MKSFSNKIKFAGLALIATSTMALAAVTYDDATGTGFVGKGDVQLAFGWNNKQLQDNAGGVGFSYNSSDTYEATCSWVTGEGTRGEKTHFVNHDMHTSVSSVVSYDARTRNQVTGFILTGNGVTVVTGSIPVVGGPCMGNEGHDGTWSAVSDGPVASTGGLFVNWNTLSVQIN
jgi:hypothetical protein